jgi:hypothetical protein
LLSFCALGRAKNASLLATTLWESRKPVMSTLEMIKKWESLCSLNNVLNPWLFHSHKFWATKVKKKQWKKTKKQKNEQPSTIDYTLVLQIMSSRLSSIFWSGPIAFPFEMMPCSQITIWFLFVLASCLKTLRPI